MEERGILIREGQSLPKGTSSPILCTNDPAALKNKLPSTKIYLIAPDVTKIARDMTQYGTVKMGIRKLRALGIINIFRIIPFALKNINRIRKSDMRALAPLLTYLDYLEMKRFRPVRVFLHYSLTDLALANNNQELITAVLALEKKGISLGLMTKNYTALCAKLIEWNMPPCAILAPFSRTGYDMRALAKECEHLAMKKTHPLYTYTSSPVEDLDKELAYLSKIPTEISFISTETS